MRNASVTTFPLENHLNRCSVMQKKEDRSGILSRTPAEGGQAIVEFTFIAITFLFVILGVIQLAMVLNAYSMVRYAAYNAARAAIVHGGSPEKMREAARLSLVATFPRHGVADQRRGYMENYYAARDTDHVAGLKYFGKPITSVAVVNHDCGGVVTFDDPADSDRGLITVQVVHQYQLVIPMVNRMVFWLYHLMDSGGSYGGQSLDYIAQQTDKERRGGEFYHIEYRIPLVAHYTMRLQSDYQPVCG